MCRRRHSDNISFKLELTKTNESKGVNTTCRFFICIQLISKLVISNSFHFKEIKLGFIIIIIISHNIYKNKCNIYITTRWLVYRRLYGERRAYALFLCVFFKFFKSPTISTIIYWVYRNFVQFLLTQHPVETDWGILQRLVGCSLFSYLFSRVQITVSIPICEANVPFFYAFCAKSIQYNLILVWFITRHS